MVNTEFIAQNQTCLICGTGKLRKFKAHASDMKSPAFINIIECKNCLFAWQYPLGRNERQSVEFFETVYACEEQAPSKYFTPDYKRKIAQLEYDFVAGLPGKSGTLLDIGAGPGIFAEVAAEHHWNVTAVDPALDIERIRNNPAITVIKGTIEQIAIGKVFDAVTMWDVIEHTANPLKQILNAGQFLKQGGWLVLETGNYKSAFRVNKGIRHWMYQVEHRWYFSPESLRKLLQKAGFSEFIFSDRMLRPGWNGSANYAGPSPRRTLKSTVKDPLHLHLHLLKYVSLMKAKSWERSGIEIFTVAAKKSGVDA